MNETIIAWLKLDKITSNNTNIKIIKILDKRLETNLGEDNGWYFKCEYEVIERGIIMDKSTEKIIKNPNWDKGVYMCATTVGDLKNMLNELPNDLRISITDPYNPYGWLDVKQMKLVVSDNPWFSDYVEVTTTRHEK